MWFDNYEDSLMVAQHVVKPVLYVATHLHVLLTIEKSACKERGQGEVGPSNIYRQDPSSPGVTM